MRILGIETSCDETAAAVVEDGKRLLSNVVLSSMDLHAAYGGVVPEIAARSHIESIIPVIDQALVQAFQGASSDDLDESSKTKPKKPERPERSVLSGYEVVEAWKGIDGIAVTYGAGLGGSLLLGVLTARTLAITHNKPLYAINHVEGHIYANFLTEVGSINNLQLAISNDGQGSALSDYKLPSRQPEFPMLGLIVSGGHSQLVLWRDHFDYTLLGQTHDDAIGEAFDKVAKILGLPYPGGPSIGKKALEGNPYAFNLPKAKMPGKYDFSFSGLKTAVLRLAQEQIGEDFTFPSTKLSERLTEPQKADIAASFQRVAVETVVDKTLMAFEEFGPKCVVIGGGVAASPELRRQLADRLPRLSGRTSGLSGKKGGQALPIKYTDPKLCTDNGAMIAALGCYKAMLSQPAADPYTLDIAPNLSM